MAKRTRVTILNGGGLRALVATAAVLERAGGVTPTLLHLDDGRAAAPRRREYLQRQADHFALRDVAVLERTYLYEAPTAQRPDGVPRAPLGTPRRLLEALAFAQQRQAVELVWPIAADGQIDAASAAQEQQVLAQQLLELEEADPADVGATPAEACRLTTPLLGYRDVEVVRLGQGLGVPWELAWSCVLDAERHCGSCPPCRRRRQAFDAAGAVDPAFSVRGRR